MYPAGGTRSHQHFQAADLVSAFVYNAGLRVTAVPTIAAAAMVLSSVSVIGNALRLRTQHSLSGRQIPRHVPGSGSSVLVEPPGGTRGKVT